MPYARAIVDGFSVLHRDPGLRALLATQPARARRHLVQRAEEAGFSLADAVTVVFDGRHGCNDAFVGFRAEVIFTAAGESADARIERMVHAAKSPSRLLVVTSDRGVREIVSAAGADTRSAGDFLAAGRQAVDQAREAVRRTPRPAAHRLGHYFPDR